MHWVPVHHQSLFFTMRHRIERVENVKSVKDYIERIDEMIDRKKNFLLKSENGF